MSPILANLFLHYAFDLWVTRHLPGAEKTFERLQRLEEEESLEWLGA